MHKRINLEWEHATIAPLLSSWLSCAHIASRRSMTTEVLASIACGMPIMSHTQTLSMLEGLLVANVPAVRWWLGIPA